MSLSSLRKVITCKRQLKRFAEVNLSQPTAGNFTEDSARAKLRWNLPPLPRGRRSPLHKSPATQLVPVCKACLFDRSDRAWRRADKW